ncbi:MAG: hypothetical protein PVJ98_11215, partial [Akkermansiaceae bacterium]
ISSPFLIEPRLRVEREFSLLYQSNPDDRGGLRFLGLSHQEVSKSGQWISSTSSPKPASDFEPAQARLVANTVLPAAKKEMLHALEDLLRKHNHLGPVCIDSFLHRTPEGLEWHAVSEINARWSMGRLAHNLRLKVCPNRSLTLTTIAKEGTLPERAIPLADPSTAHTRIPVVLPSSTAKTGGN